MRARMCGCAREKRIERERKREREREGGRTTAAKGEEEYDVWWGWGCGIVITSKVIIIITAGWSHALASLKLWSLCKAVVLSVRGWIHYRVVQQGRCEQANADQHIDSAPERLQVVAVVLFFLFYSTRTQSFSEGHAKSALKPLRGESAGRERRQTVHLKSQIDAFCPEAIHISSTLLVFWGCFYVAHKRVMFVGTLPGQWNNASFLWMKRH